MAEMIINSESLTDIADSIRAKTGSSEAMTVAEMPMAISGISSGGGTEWEFNNDPVESWTLINKVTLTENDNCNKVYINQNANGETVSYDELLLLIVGDVAGESLGTVTSKLLINKETPYQGRCATFSNLILYNNWQNIQVLIQKPFYHPGSGWENVYIPIQHNRAQPNYIIGTYTDDINNGGRFNSLYGAGFAIDKGYLRCTVKLFGRNKLRTKE